MRFSGARTRRRVGVMRGGNIFSHSHLSSSIPGSPVSPLPPARLVRLGSAERAVGSPSAEVV